MRTMKRLVRPGLLIAALSGASCPVSAEMPGNGTVQIEFVGSPYVTLQNTWASASADKAQTVLYGHIARNRAPFVGGGFVDATVIDVHGQVLETVRSNYIPRSSRNEREYLARYRLALGDVPAGARVRLSYSSAFTTN